MILRGPRAKPCYQVFLEAIPSLAVTFSLIHSGTFLPIKFLFIAISGTSQAICHPNLRHMSCKSRKYLRQILASLRHISSISQAYVRNITGIISEKSQAYIKYSSSIYQASLRYIWCKSRQTPWQISGYYLNQMSEIYLTSWFYLRFLFFSIASVVHSCAIFILLIQAIV